MAEHIQSNVKGEQVARHEFDIYGEVEKRIGRLASTSGADW